MATLKIQIVILFLLLNISWSFAQESLYSFIQEQGIEFNLDIDTPLHENFIEQDINKYRVFFSGEIHGIPSNPIIKYKLFEYLYRNANVRNLILEAGMSSAFIAEQYLKTGDEKYLCSSCWKLEMVFWRKLFAFNQTMAENDKIRIIGIDFERNEPFIKAIDEILPKKNPPASLSPSIAYLRQIVEDSLIGEQRIGKVNYAKKELCSNVQEFKDYFGDYFGVFSKIINNPVPYTPGVKRDKKAYQNFLSQIEEGYDGNFFGQYGISHINLTFGNIADLVNSKRDSPFVNKVFVLIPHYFNCTSYYNSQLSDGDSGYGILAQSGIKKDECIQINNGLNYDVTFLMSGELIKYKKLKNGASAILLIQDQKTKENQGVNMF
jgi:hypothetical protein